VILIFKTGVFILRAPVFICGSVEFKMMNLIYQTANYKLLFNSVAFKVVHFR